MDWSDLFGGRGTGGSATAPSIVNAYREKILYALAAIATVVIMPFSLLNLLTGRTLVGVTTMAVVLMFLSNAVAIHLRRRLPVPIPVAFATIVITLVIAIWQRGLLGIFWSFPAILLLHFIMERRLANLFNLTLVVLAGGVSFHTLQFDVALRIVVAQLLTIVFTNIFSYVLEAEQKKEAEQRERLALLVSATRAGSYQWDRGAPSVTYSARMKEMLGYAADSDTSTWPPYQELVHPDDREARYRLFLEGTRDRSVKNGVRRHIPGDYRLIHARGHYIWVHAEGIFIHDADGVAVRYIASLIDVTERYNHAEELRQSSNQIAVQAQQLRDQNEALRAAIGVREEVERIARHDLKTPINSILAVPRLLREGRKLDAREEELLGMVDAAAWRMLDLVNMSVDLYRMEQGEYTFSPRAVDLTALAETVAREVRAHALTKDVDVSVRLGGVALHPGQGQGQRVHAWGSELLCYSIIANLLKNAVEASPDGGVVSADFESGPAGVVLRIHNAGVVAPKVRDTFFEKYATSGKVGGFGLGTYSARLMARVQRGDLQMSTSEEAGTTLTLRLPAVPVASIPAPADADGDRTHRPPERPLPSLRVLVVDDDEFNVAFMRHALPSPPLQVQTAINGRAALAAAQASPPDVVFMDLEMPVMDGFAALVRLREIEAQGGRRRSTVVAFSSYDDEAIRRRCRAAGFDSYLSKPAARERIHEILHTVAEGGTLAEPVVAQAFGGAGVAVAEAGPHDEVVVSEDLRPTLPKFFASREALIGELRTAIDAGDSDAARRTAHKLAGSFALYGFAWASAESRAMQRSAEDHQLAGLGHRCDELRRHIARVKMAMNLGGGEAGHG